VNVNTTTLIHIDEQLFHSVVVAVAPAVSMDEASSLSNCSRLLLSVVVGTATAPA